MSNSKCVRFLDLAVTDRSERAILMNKLDDILSRGQIVLGPEVAEFELSTASYCGRKYSIAVGSGTDALILSIKAMHFPPGSEIITTPLSWVASVNAIVLNGLVPVFADIDETLTIDCSTIEPLISKKTVGILAVDFAGHPSNYSMLNQICDTHSLTLIQDASQAFGARDDLGYCGKHGEISAVSHNSMKTLASFGEAGSVLTDNEELAERIKILRYAGTINKEDCVMPSYNSRMDTIQAAFLLHRLKSLDQVIAKRNSTAQIYIENLPREIGLPLTASNTLRHAYYTFQIFSERRDDLHHMLDSRGIETKIQHRLLIPQHQYYLGNFRGNFPFGKEVVRKSLCIPCSEKITTEDQHYVLEMIEDCCRELKMDELR